MVLRYEKRTKKYGAKMNRYKITVQEETIDDAILAIELLARQPEADSTRLTLIGHSLGATLAPEIVTQAPAVDAVAMLAPTARPFEVVISDQLRYIASIQDTLGAAESAKLHAELEKAQQITAETLMPTKTLLNVPASYYYDLHKRDQHAYARALGKPIFVARGTKDYQASQIEYMMWQDILKDSRGAAFRSYDNCYHIFITTDARPGPWNYQMEGNVVETLIDDLESWCKSFSLPAADPPGGNTVPAPGKKNNGVVTPDSGDGK